MKNLNVKINLNSDFLYEFAECFTLLTSGNALVGMDVVDVEDVFTADEEITFFVAADETLEKTYEKLTTYFPELKYNGILIIFAIKEGLLDSIGVERIDNACGEFVNEYLGDDGTVIWNVYETEQEENCRIYMFLGDKIPK